MTMVMVVPISNSNAGAADGDDGGGNEGHNNDNEVIHTHLAGDVPSSIQLAVHPEPWIVESAVEHCFPESNSSAPDLPLDTSHYWNSQVICLLGWGCSSAARASDRHAAGVGSISRCGK